MMNRYLYLTIFGLFFSLTTATVTKAQTYSNYAMQWQIAENISIDFRTTPPTVTAASQNTSWEGNSTVTDASGNLLFYTDGITVWNKNHQVMQNGSGLQGHSSSSNSAVAFPRPNKAGQWYVTVMPLNGNMTYNRINMNSNGGLGKVTGQKNIVMQSFMGERQGVVHHANGTDYWVVAHGTTNNTFYAFQVSQSGINTTPVVSSLGPTPWGALGVMKISPNGKKIAYADHNDGSVQLFDFNTSTGVVSNHNQVASGYTLAYGVEFSPDNTKLYATLGPTYQDIYQWDLCAGTNSAIRSSQVLVGSSTGSWGGALQIGPDGKIYVAQYLGSHLGVINNPNTYGTAAGYVENGLFLQGQTSRLGLPNAAVSQFSSTGTLDGCGLLSLELQTFDGRYEGQDKVKLTWQNIDESEVVRYRLERSLDGVGFEELAVVDKTTGSQHDGSYEHFDFAPVKGSNFYRLAIEDLTGERHYQDKVVEIQISETGVDIQAWPNPASNTLNLTIKMSSENDKGEAWMFNTLGQKVWNQTITSDFQDYSIDVSNFTPGIYYLKYEEGNFTTTKKIIVQ